MDVLSGEDYVAMLRRRDYGEVVDILWPIRDELFAEPHPVRFRSLCCVLLRAGYLSESIEHFEQLIDVIRPDMRNDGDYCELGAGHWLLGNDEEAVASWQQALKCNYGDGAKNMTPALLLYYGAVRTHDEALKQAAINQIEKKLETGWAKNWPAPLGRFLVEAAGVDHVEEELSAQHPVRQPDERCRFDFYKGVKFLEEGDKVSAKSCFRSAVDHREQKTNSTEFVLARHELGETPSR